MQPKQLDKKEMGERSSFLPCWVVICHLKEVLWLSFRTCFSCWLLWAVKWIPQAEEPEIYGAFWEPALLFPWLPFQHFQILVLAGWLGLSGAVGRLDGHLSIGCPVIAACIGKQIDQAASPICTRHKRWGSSWKQARCWWPSVLWKAAWDGFALLPLPRASRVGVMSLGISLADL